ncbi:MAG: hypothetical protein LBV59_07640 [Sphingobacterium sp.]|jgi:hypothetical protein|uniref:hypothetical protein n=1 Tax=Sphingobacterium sp. TaxID=341027 RepID=UPI0028515509|nr:hypothetical protein [Sphingobacterium sp.]MDR3007791.1 hypothetical protein [Sphingobacterium sp.]
MKKYITFFGALIITFINVVLVASWLIDVQYKIDETALNQKYQLPLNLKIDYWGTDISLNDYGVVLVDNSDFLVLHKNKRIATEQIVLGELDSICFNHNKVWVVSRQDKLRTTVEVKANHQVIINDNVEKISKDNCISLKDPELISWLKHKNSTFIDLSSLTIILLISLFINLYLIRSFLHNLKSKRADGFIC